VALPVAVARYALSMPRMLSLVHNLISAYCRRCDKVYAKQPVVALSCRRVLGSALSSRRRRSQRSDTLFVLLSARLGRTWTAKGLTTMLDGRTRVLQRDSCSVVA